MHAVMVWVLIAFSPTPHDLGLFQTSGECTKARADYRRQSTGDHNILDCRPQKRLVFDDHFERTR